MKYLIFGVQGMAGHMIAEYLLEQGHTVVGFARTKALAARPSVQTRRMKKQWSRRLDPTNLIM